MRNKVTLWYMKSHARYKAWDIKISSEPQIRDISKELLISWRAVRNERVRGGRRGLDPPCWCWSQADAVALSPGEDGASTASIIGGLVLSCPTGGGHGRSFMTLISTAESQTEPEKERRKEGWRKGGQEKGERSVSEGRIRSAGQTVTDLETGNRKETNSNAERSGLKHQHLGRCLTL